MYKPMHSHQSPLRVSVFTLTPGTRLHRYCQTLDLPTVGFCCAEVWPDSRKTPRPLAVMSTYEGARLWADNINESRRAARSASRAIHAQRVASMDNPAFGSPAWWRRFGGRISAITA